MIQRLARHRGGPAASLVVKIGEAVAAADCRLDPREQQVLQRIAAALEQAPSASSDTRS
ncbi:MAG: TerB family tellurite resistance protein [Stellaceae bacterium]